MTWTARHAAASPPSMQTHAPDINPRTTHAHRARLAPRCAAHKRRNRHSSAPPKQDPEPVRLRLDPLSLALARQASAHRCAHACCRNFQSLKSQLRAQAAGLLLRARRTCEGVPIVSASHQCRSRTCTAVARTSVIPACESPAAQGRAERLGGVRHRKRRHGRRGHTCGRGRIRPPGGSTAAALVAGVRSPQGIAHAWDPRAVRLLCHVYRGDDGG